MARVANVLPGNITATLRLIELLLQGESPGDALQQLEILQQTLPRLPDGSHDLFRRILELMQNGKTKNAFDTRYKC